MKLKIKFSPESEDFLRSVSQDERISMESIVRLAVKLLQLEFPKV